MNKIARISLILITLLTIGCNKGRHIEEEANEQGIKQVSFGIYADYGEYVKDKVTLLIGSSTIPFKKEKYNIDTLVVGDFVTVDYTGELYILETYPSQWYMNEMQIKDVKVTHGKVYEFEVTANPGYGQSIICLSGKSFDYGCSHVINEDGSYIEHFDECPIGTKLYGVHPSHFASQTILAFYSYNPLAD